MKIWKCPACGCTDTCTLHAGAAELLEACKEARQVLVMAVRTNVTGIDFDPAEHLTVKKLDAAIAKAEGRP